MGLRARLIAFSLNHPKQIIVVVLTMTVLLGVSLLRVVIDNGPGTLFLYKELTRTVDQQIKEDVTRQDDTVLLGVVNHSHKQGVFNPQSLGKIITLSRYAATVATSQQPEQPILARDIIAPDKVESILQAGLGQVRFDWLMQDTPRSTEAAQRIRDLALANPLLKGSLVSPDGRALLLHFPVTGQEGAKIVSRELRNKIQALDKGDDRFHLSGPPVVADAVDKTIITRLLPAALLTSLVLFGAIWLHFKSIQLTLLPLAVASIAVISTMGLLFTTGNSLHVINLSIPFIILPHAVAGSMHLVSAFFDFYPGAMDRRQALERAMEAVYTPLLHTALILASAFASLVFLPIPLIRTFGAFVAVGTAIALLLTFVFIPATILWMKEDTLLGIRSLPTDRDRYSTLLDSLLQSTFQRTCQSPWYSIGISLTILALGVLGLTLTQVNSNPLKLLQKDHELQLADKALNSKFGGIHAVRLILSGTKGDLSAEDAADWLAGQLHPLIEKTPLIRSAIMDEIRQAEKTTSSGSELAEVLASSWAARLNKLPLEESLGHDTWSRAVDTLGQLLDQQQLFRQPDVLTYIESLQHDLNRQEEVGTTHSVIDAVKKIHQELFEGDPARFTIPETANGVGQTLQAFAGSNRPNDLYQFISPDYSRTTIHIQLNSGDSRDLQRLLIHVDDYLRANHPPMTLQYRWAGPSYLNLMVEKEILRNMFKSLALCLAVTLLVMSLVLRSLLWGLLALVPLSGAVALIFALIGLTAWEYNMVIAPLTFLGLGLAVDFATHFLHRSRLAMEGCGDWPRALAVLSGQPARSVARCTVVIAASCIPLLFILLPFYQTMGILLMLIALFSGLTTLSTLTALLTVLQPGIFRKEISLFQAKAKLDAEQAGQANNRSDTATGDGKEAGEPREDPLFTLANKTEEPS